MRFNFSYNKYAGETVVVNFSIENLEEDIAATSPVYSIAATIIIDNKKIEGTYISPSEIGVKKIKGILSSLYSFKILPSLGLVLQADTKVLQADTKAIIDLKFTHKTHANYIVIKRIIINYSSQYTN